ncbi:MAG TPA: DUF2085 domain-containing protein [Vicinamibacterales bacterium]
MLVRALVVASGLWVMAVMFAPLAIASRQPVLSLAAAGVYSAGARVCHQRPDRCFSIHGRPMPVCARCTGLYFSAAIAAPLALFWASRLSSRRARLVAAMAALPTLVTWGTEIAGLAHPSNTTRAIAALPLGFAAAWLVIATLPRGPRPHHEDDHGHTDHKAPGRDRGSGPSVRMP